MIGLRYSRKRNGTRREDPRVKMAEQPHEDVCQSNAQCQTSGDIQVRTSFVQAEMSTDYHGNSLEDIQGEQCRAASPHHKLGKPAQRDAAVGERETESKEDGTRDYDWKVWAAFRHAKMPGHACGIEVHDVARSGNDDPQRNGGERNPRKKGFHAGFAQGKEHARRYAEVGINPPSVFFKKDKRNACSQQHRDQRHARIGPFCAAYGEGDINEEVGNQRGADKPVAVAQTFPPH